MDLHRTIPTSFVPQPASAAGRRFGGGMSSDFTGAFSFLAYAVFVIIIVLAVGVFFYGRILASSQASKDAALANAEASIDPTTVEGFLRLSNRLSSSATLLNGHIALSGFFNLIETLLPTPVRFNSLHINVADPTKITLDATGIAKNFNALAFTSTAFAADGRIKDAIFSNLTINKDNSVSFALSATLDPTLVTFSAPSSPSAATSTSP